MLASEEGVWAQALWGALEDAGIRGNAVASNRRAGPASLSEALRLAGSAAAFGARIRSAKTTPRRGFSACRAAAQRGPATIAPSNADDVPVAGAATRLAADRPARRVPWGPHANAVVVVASRDGRARRAGKSQRQVTSGIGSNIAREARHADLRCAR